MSAFLLAFFALLRIIEVVALEADCILLRESEIVVHIRNSKIDQLGFEASVRLDIDKDSAFFILFTESNFKTLP